MRTLLAPALILGLFGLPSPSTAHDQPPAMNRVSFQVEARREVANDRITATIGVTEEDRDPAALAQRINETMAWALATAKKAKGVEVESGGYQTSPVYDDRRIVRWRGSQNLVLESGEVTAVAELIGELQARLAVRSIRFSVSPALRKTVEEELLDEALAAFRARADRIRKSFERRNYNLVQVSVGAQGTRPVYAQARAQAESYSVKVAPPALEGGVSTVTVNANGTIELE